MSQVTAPVSLDEVNRLLLLLLLLLLPLNSGIVRRNSMWDYLVFRKVQNLLGGRVRVIMSGAAPISPRVLDFLRVAFGCSVSGQRGALASSHSPPLCTGHGGVWTDGVQRCSNHHCSWRDHLRPCRSTDPLHPCETDGCAGYGVLCC